MMLSVQLKLCDQPQCVIWAVTAMNETEIQDQVCPGILDGVSVKPMGFDILAEILNYANVNYLSNEE